jgi:DNA-directed RNA polymerase specialized sigma24 family protein
MARAIDDLPEVFRSVLVARLVGEVSVEATADLLDLRPETVKTLLHRARALLRRVLEDQLGAALTARSVRRGALSAHRRSCYRMSRNPA